MPRAQNSKLLNWRTSQADRVPPPSQRGTPSVVTAEGGKLVFTGDWCVESSFEGCHRAALAAATAVAHTLASLPKPPLPCSGVANGDGDGSGGRGLPGDYFDGGGDKGGGKGGGKVGGGGKGSGKGGGKGWGYGKGRGGRGSMRGSKRGHDSLPQH